MRAGIRDLPHWVWVAAVAAVALSLRVAYAWQVRILPVVIPEDLDPGFYYSWAREIAAGDWIGRDPFVQSPLYAYLLGLLIKVFGDGLAGILLAQALVGCGTVLLVYAAGRRFFDPGRALIAALLVALYAPLIFYEGMVMKTFLSPFLTMLLAILIDRAREASERGPAGRALLAFGMAGATFGLLTLDRDNFILLAPALAALALALGGGLSARGLRSAGAFTLGAALLIAPVTLRNWAVSGEFVLLTTGGGEVFFIGNNADANGLYVPPAFVRPDPLYEHGDFVERASEIAGRPLTAMESSWFWFRQGLDFILEEPLRWIGLLWLKTVHFWNYFELPDNLDYLVLRHFSPLLESLNATFPPAWLPSLKAPVGGRWIASRLHLFSTFGTLAPLGLVGLYLTRRSRRRLLTLHVLLFGYMATVLVFFNFSRFRVPVVPILALFAATSLLSIGRFLARCFRLGVAVASRSGDIVDRARALRPDRRQWVAIGLFAVLAIWVNLERPRGLVPQIERALVIGNAYYGLGEPEKARRNYMLGIYLLGEGPGGVAGDELLRRRFGPEASREAFRRELEIERTARGPQFRGMHVGIHHGLGIALVQEAEDRLGRGERSQAMPLLDAAILQFEEVLRLAPSYLLSLRKMARAHALKGDNASAVEWLRKAVDLWPEDLLARIELAEALFNGGDGRAALRQLDAALAQDSSRTPREMAQLYYNRGVVLYRGLSEPGRALYAFERALALDPDLPQGPQVRSATLEMRARGYQPLTDAQAGAGPAGTRPGPQRGGPRPGDRR